MNNLGTSASHGDVSAVTLRDEQLVTDLEEERFRRVNLGCGQSPTPGWLNFDSSPVVKLASWPRLTTVLHRLGFLDETQYEFARYARTNRITFGDAVKGLPLSAGSVDVFYASHVLEHLERAEAAALLEEARRVLRVGGSIRLVVSDLRKQVDEYIESADADAFVEQTFLVAPPAETVGRRLTELIIGYRHRRWMYDGPSLARLLEEHGFRDVRILQPGETGIGAPGELDLHERASESVYVEAKL